MLSAEVNSYLFNNARLQPACEWLSKSLLSITGSGIRNSTSQPRNALVSLHCQLPKRKKLSEEQSCQAAPIPSHSSMHRYPWLTKGKSKASRKMKNNSNKQNTRVFSARASAINNCICRLRQEKKILVRTKRNLTSSSHSLNLECQI